MHDCGVGDRARQRAGIDVVAEGVARGVVGHDAERRLQPDQPRARGRPAHRARAVGAERERAEARGHGRRTAAARAARRALEVPRIARDAERRAIGQALHAELRRRRLGEDDRARVAQAFHEDVVRGGRRIALEDRRAVPRRHALHVDQVLDADRHAMQRPERIAAHDGLLGLLRVAAGVVGHHLTEAVELRVGLFGRLQHGVEILDRRKLLRANEGGGLCGGCEKQIGIGHGRTIALGARHSSGAHES